MTNGLSIPPLRASYMLQYRNGLIGKHFKSIQQLAIFHLDDSLCSPLERDLWKATGELGALLWYYEIENMPMYLKDLEILIGNVLDIWSLIDPQRVFVKPKLHILSHILEDVRHHGPPPLYSTEIFECFNAIFRMCSVLSNHQAPSRDIAWTCADLDRFKHEISGGWWKGQDGKFVQAGVRVRQYFNNTQVQRRLGFVSKASHVAGTMHCPAKMRKSAQTWASFRIQSSARGLSFADETRWYPCTYIISRQEDRCIIGSWVFVEHNSVTYIGRISYILTPADGQICAASVVLEEFILTNSRHPKFNMPEVLRREGTGVSHIVVKPEVAEVLFIVNVQHNCLDGQCAASGQHVRRQERQDTEITEPMWEHSDDNKFILNLHALHNAALTRRILPRYLTEPLPYLQDRISEHKDMAAKLRVIHDARRQKEADARKARQQKKKSTTAGAGAGKAAEEVQQGQPEQSASANTVEPLDHEQVVDGGAASGAVE
ncbi:hypothetical protein A0H81_11962 [Grifola frondosa]|uniref:Uncharacterized protein n=1 Tax=Grifola frondosa TaxID=5627 RepID=A0A1C7LVC2_GRIFR|nr:hypothetical protein A0H81_11962 [Grifola frondosa]